MWRAKRILVAFMGILLGSGCALAPWASQPSVQEAIELAKVQGGSGCFYLRVTGAYPPFGTASFLAVEVYDSSRSDTLGVAGADAKTKLTFKDCMGAIPEQYRTPLLVPLQ